MRNLRLPFLSTILLALAAYVTEPYWPRSFDSHMERFIAKHNVPGAVVAFGPAGQPPTVRAYGNLSADQELPLASLSKPITSEAIMALVDAGKVALDEPLSKYAPEVLDAADGRHRAITIRHLLQHTAGWDRKITFDPLEVAVAKSRLAVDSTDCYPVAVAMLAQPLQFSPGERGEYSNLGYCWLGVVIARASGKPYEEFVRQAVLDPARIEMAYPVADVSLYGPSAAWSAKIESVHKFYSRPLRGESREKPMRVSRRTPSYGLGWKLGDTGHGHVGRFRDSLSLLNVAVHTPDDYVFVVMLNKSPDLLADAVSALEGDLLAASRGRWIKAQ